MRQWVRHCLALRNGVCDVALGDGDVCSVLACFAQPRRGGLPEKFTYKNYSPDFSVEVVCLKVMRLKEKSDSWSSESSLGNTQLRKCR